MYIVIFPIRIRLFTCFYFGLLMKSSTVGQKHNMADGQDKKFGKLKFS